ncbi:hypothetical protein ACVWYG_001784 [Pedobacter sp. UYEF25]
MKRLFNSVIVGLILTFSFSFLVHNNASAQRPSRSGGGSRGGASVSRAPSVRSAPQRIQSSRSYNGVQRSSYGYSNRGYRQNYRPSYRYRPAYYGYYNFYRPFIGFRLNILPYGYYPFYYGDQQYYYYGGLFYRPFQNSYEVVVPPVGADVPTLPSGAKSIAINGTDYYEYKGVYYTEKVNSDNQTVYVVAGKDGVLNTSDGLVDTHQIGDIVKQLPPDSQEITIKNETLYISPDGVYYEQVVDGDNISYQVVGRAK